MTHLLAESGAKQLGLFRQRVNGAWMLDDTDRGARLDTVRRLERLGLATIAYSGSCWLARLTPIGEGVRLRAATRGVAASNDMVRALQKAAK